MDQETKDILFKAKVNRGELSIISRIAGIYAHVELKNFVQSAQDQGVIGGGKLWLLYKDIHSGDIDKTYNDVISGVARDSLKCLPSYSYYFEEDN